MHACWLHMFQPVRVACHAWLRIQHANHMCCTLHPYYSSNPPLLALFCRRVLRPVQVQAHLRGGPVQVAVRAGKAQLAGLQCRAQQACMHRRTWVPPCWGSVGLFHAKCLSKACRHKHPAAITPKHCAQARKKVAERGWKNVTIVEADACQWAPPEGCATLVTFSYSLSSAWAGGLLAERGVRLVCDGR